MQCTRHERQATAIETYTFARTSSHLVDCPVFYSLILWKWTFQVFCPRLNFRVLSLHSSVSSYNLCKFVESWNYLLHKCNQKHFCTCKVIDPPIDLVRASIQVVKASKDSTKTVGILSFFPLASTTFGSLRQSLYMLASATMSFSAAHSLVYICIIYTWYTIYISFPSMYILTTK